MFCKSELYTEIFFDIVKRGFYASSSSRLFKPHEKLLTPKQTRSVRVCLWSAPVCERQVGVPRTSYFNQTKNKCTQLLIYI